MQRIHVLCRCAPIQTGKGVCAHDRSCKGDALDVSSCNLQLAPRSKEGRHCACVAPAAHHHALRQLVPCPQFHITQLGDVRQTFRGRVARCYLQSWSEGRDLSSNVVVSRSAGRVPIEDERLRVLQDHAVDLCLTHQTLEDLRGMTANVGRTQGKGVTQCNLWCQARLHGALQGFEQCNCCKQVKAPAELGSARPTSA